MDVCQSPSIPHAAFFPPDPPPRRPSVWLRRIADDRADLVRFWPVVTNMVVQELRVRYQRSILGFLWTLVNPLLMLATMSLVFSVIFKMENYTFYLFAGMVPWNFMGGSIGESAMCIVVNEGLIRKIYVPKLVFPLVRVLINLVTFLLTMVAVFVLLVPMGARLAPPIVLLPAAIGLFMAFTLGLCLLVATANTFFRDCGHLVGVFLQAWYFATPIVYKSDMFPASTLWRFRLNPAYYFIELFHDLMVNHRWPTLSTWALAMAIALVSLGTGYVIFKSNEDKMVFRL